MKKAASAYPQSQTTFDDINRRIWEHLTERGWTDNPPRGVATSIALEAAELLEHYQWNDTPVGDRQALAEELADILIYCFQFAELLEIDMATEIIKKLEKSARKYPAASFAGKTTEERRQAWIDAKLQHKKEGL